MGWGFAARSVRSCRGGCLVFVLCRALFTSRTLIKTSSTLYTGHFASGALKTPIKPQKLRQSLQSKTLVPGPFSPPAPEPKAISTSEGRLP